MASSGLRPLAEQLAVMSTALAVPLRKSQFSFEENSQQARHLAEHSFKYIEEAQQNQVLLKTLKYLSWKYLSSHTAGQEHLRAQFAVPTHCQLARSARMVTQLRVAPPDATGQNEPSAAMAEQSQS